jgi:hypothetical protein
MAERGRSRQAIGDYDVGVTYLRAHLFDPISNAQTLYVFLVENSAVHGHVSRTLNHVENGPGPFYRPNMRALIAATYFG